MTSYLEQWLATGLKTDRNILNELTSLTDWYFDLSPVSPVNVFRHAKTVFYLYTWKINLPLLHCYSLIATANLAFFAAIAPRIFQFSAAKNSQPYPYEHSWIWAWQCWMDCQTWRCDALVVDLQVLAGSWTRIYELIAVDAHNTPWSTFTPAQMDR